MPTHDFHCIDCGHVFEHRLPFGSTELPSCDACESACTEKKITPPAIHFKGCGFYKTDSTAKSPAANTAKDPLKESSKDPSKEPEKTEKPKEDTTPSQCEASETKPEKSEAKPDKTAS